MGLDQFAVGFFYDVSYSFLQFVIWFYHFVH